MRHPTGQSLKPMNGVYKMSLISFLFFHIFKSAKCVYVAIELKLRSTCFVFNGGSWIDGEKSQSQTQGSQRRCNESDKRKEGQPAGQFTN